MLKFLKYFAPLCCLAILIPLQGLGAASSAEAKSDEVVEVSDSTIFTAGDAFIAMPRQYLDILTISMRQDMLDYMLADSIRRQQNVFLSESWIEKMTPDYMSVHLTDASSLQIKILPLIDKKWGENVVLTIYTVTADNGMADSTLKFWSEDMKELPLQKFFTLPDPKSFFSFPKGEKVNKKEIYELIPFYTIRYSIGPGPAELQGELTNSDYLTLEQAAKVKPYLRPGKSWIWRDGKFHPSTEAAINKLNI